jgi:uncharacterized protein (TIGR03435 family)
MQFLIGLFCAAVTAGTMFAQSAPLAPAFDIADVHASASATNPYTLVSGGVLRGDRYDLRKATMLDMIRLAWGISPDAIVGGPNWLEFDRFDIAAKAPPSTSPEAVKLMLQTLLTDRFKLVLRKDTRPLPAFALTKGIGKPRMQPANGAGETNCQYQRQSATASYIVFSCHNMTMAAFAPQLRGMAADYLTDPVVDATGLEGAWDFDLKWNPRSQVLQSAEHTTIFDAVSKQLGLTLEWRKAPAPVVVIDRVNEVPTANSAAAVALPPRPVEFDVAVLKPSRPDETESFSVTPGGGLEAHAVLMKILIATAWDVDWDHIDDFLVDAPKWIDSARFDIVARPSNSTKASPPPGSFIDDELRLMLRTLLTERFQIKTHYENRPGNAYFLVSSKPKLKKADPANRSSCKDARSVARDPRDLNPRLSKLLQCQNITMAQFAGQLLRLAPDYLSNPVTDATGIPGNWDFMLNFTPSYQLRNAPAADGVQSAGTLTASDPGGGISLFEAVTKQLGLKLEMRRGMLPKLVIDHIEEKPLEN